VAMASAAKRVRRGDLVLFLVARRHPRWRLVVRDLAGVQVDDAVAPAQQAAERGRLTVE
jgi:hypothetical protein